MPSKQPILGSLAIQGPSIIPRVVHISSSTCHNLSLFKDLMKEYRQLDDQITTRLNRSNAQFRDRDRLHSTNGNVQDEACAHLWKELLENWKRRKAIVDYCIAVVDDSTLDKTRRGRNGEEQPPTTDRELRATQAADYSDEVKRNHLHNELVVESIIRQRSLNVFRSRCKFFEPTLEGSDRSETWDDAARLGPTERS